MLFSIQFRIKIIISDYDSYFKRLFISNSSTGKFASLTWGAPCKIVSSGICRQQKPRSPAHLIRAFHVILWLHTAALLHWGIFYFLRSHFKYYMHATDEKLKSNWMIKHNITLDILRFSSLSTAMGVDNLSVCLCSGSTLWKAMDCTALL